MTNAHRLVEPPEDRRVESSFGGLVDEVAPRLAWHAESAIAHDRWRETFRTKALELVGRMPRPVPPAVRWTETTDFGTFTRYKVYVRSEEQYWVPAYYFVPNNLRGPARPAIVCLHGHSGIYPYIREGSEQDQEKGRKHQLDYAPYLAEHGYVTIAPIIRGWDETCGREDWSFGHARSCIHVTNSAFLLGMTPVGLRCWDAMRLIDFLETQEQVDPDRIGIGGLSGGGMLSLFLPLLDERVKLTMIAGYFSSFRSSIYAIDHCVCNVVPGMMAWGEMSDLVAAYAPLPTLLINGTQDPIFPIAAARTGLKTLNAVYGLLGNPDNVEADFFDGVHEWSNRKTLPFLEKHFGPLDEAKPGDPAP